MNNYAGFWIRFIANIIDSLLLMLPSMLIGATYGSHFIFAISGGLIVGLLYYPFFESSVLAATPGKALLGLAVVNENYEPITFKQACIRHLSKFVSAMVMYIGYLMQPFTSRRQTLHDMMSETVVIRRESDPNLNYFRVWLNQVKFIFNKL